MGVLIDGPRKDKHECDLPREARRGAIYWCDCGRKYKCTYGNADSPLMELHWSRRFRWFGPPVQHTHYWSGQQRVNSSKTPPPTLAYPPKPPPPPKYKDGGPIVNWFMPPAGNSGVHYGQSKATVANIEIVRHGLESVYIHLRHVDGMDEVVDKSNTIAHSGPVMVTLDYIGSEIVGIELIGEQSNDNES